MEPFLHHILLFPLKEALQLKSKDLEEGGMLRFILMLEHQESSAPHYRRILHHCYITRETQAEVAESC